MTDQTPIAVLVAAIEPVERLNNTPVKDRNIDGVGLMALMSHCCNAAIDALPSLRRLAQIEAENTTLRAQLHSAALEIAERSQELAAAQAQVAALLPLAKFGLEVRDATRDDLDSFVYCEECDHRNYNSEEQRLRGLAEKHGLCKVTENYRDEKRISVTIEWPHEPKSLDDLTALAAQHDQAIRQQERERAVAAIERTICGQNLSRAEQHTAKRMIDAVRALKCSTVAGEQAEGGAR